MIKEIQAQDVSDRVTGLCMDASYYLGQDTIAALERAAENEVSPVGREVLNQLLQNARIAREERIPLCQDTGVAVAFVKLGQDVRIVGGDLTEAINAGVRAGYRQGYLRKSIADKPVTARTNTRDNTPAVIHVDLVPGDSLEVVMMTKGGGCENMSALKMLSPSQGRDGVVDFVVDCMSRAGGKPCPPTIVGVGIGGTADYAAYLAKRSILRPVGQPNPDPDIAALEAELLERINQLGIGPMGLGGRTTALAVHVETFPCHIASLPVAVNPQCHSNRWKSAAW